MLAGEGNQQDASGSLTGPKSVALVRHSKQDAQPASVDLPRVSCHRTSDNNRQCLVVNQYVKVGHFSVQTMLQVPTRQVSLAIPQLSQRQWFKGSKADLG